MQDDIEHSRNRWLDQEELRTKLTGFGTNRQGRAILRKYRDPLAKLLDADRRHPRNREIWRALKDADLVGEQAQTALFIDRLLTMGITAAAGYGIGVDDDGIKNFRDQAIWLGQHLGLRRSQRALEFRAGAWALDRLNGLPVFARDEEDVLTIPLTPGLDEFLNAVVEAGIRNDAFLFPLGQQPEPWTQVSKGGLSPNHWARVSLISSCHPKSENAVRKAIADGKMRPVLDAVNYLAGTPFTINKPVLAFMQRREEPRIQKLSAEIATLAREHERLKLKWAKGQKLAKLKTELKVWELDMAVAKNILACRERFWVPLQVDFRGRINPLPFFNFTRQDHIRALFLFDCDEPIGEEGLCYLKAHVAACADGNKWSTVERPGNLDLAGRVAWTDANLPLLRRIGEAVLRGEDPAQWEWMLQPDMAETLVTFAKPGGDIVEISCGDSKREGISDPYSFIAACVELAQALDAGPSFKTRLPLVFDATCSGLQQICAMTRAEEGRYVNLVPSKQMSDFYSLVGVTVYRRAYDEIPEHLRALDDKGFPKQIPDEKLGLLRCFKDGNPFDRKIVKRPGMTYGYGSRAGGWQKTKRGHSRPKGMTEQIVEVLKDRGQSAKDAHKLAKAAYDVIEELMSAAKTLRNFLEKIAKVCTKYNKPLRWETPLGLPVLNAYYEPIKERISVKIDGKRRRTNLITGDSDDVDTNANTSVTANFIHSSDACHLQMVANATAKEAIPLVTIHDCFGTTAPHAKRLNEIIREQFVQLHENYNWLEQVLASAKRDLPKSTHDKLPRLPQRGNLNLSGVLQSFFAFK